MPQPEALAEWGDGHCCPHFLLSGIKLPQHVTGLVTSGPWVWGSKKNPNCKAGKDLSGPGWYLSGTGCSLPFTTVQVATVPEGASLCHQPIDFAWSNLDYSLCTLAPGVADPHCLLY